jgi:glutamate synthase domain-containing protein 3
MAEHLRKILSELGLDHPRDLIGRTDLMRQTISDNSRWDSLDLSEFLLDFHQGKKREHDLVTKTHHQASDKNLEILEAAKEVLKGTENSIAIPLRLENSDHAIGATLAGEIAKRKLSRDDKGITIDAKGYAGHAFGFGATNGMQLRLEGYANDSIGEAMGGNTKIVVVQPRQLKGSRTPHLIGNAAAYGATGGTMYVAGKAGQRFGVRNSGATLVCEGVGKYAFEYMTGGLGVVLGRCGPCIGSGMTGGELFIYDPEGEVRSRINSDMITQHVDPESDQEKTLKAILGDFLEETKSPHTAAIFNNWSEAVSHFTHVTPRNC